MNAKKIMTMQKLYTTIGKIINDFSEDDFSDVPESATPESNNSDDSDASFKNKPDYYIERLKDAQECVMDAAMLAIERSFEEGTLNVN